MRVLVLVGLIACGGSTVQPAGDAPSDTSIGGGTHSCQGAPQTEIARCVAGGATTDVHLYTPGAGTHSMCFQQLQQSSATCTSGCAVEGKLTIGDSTLGLIAIFGSAAQVLCAETREAQAGDPCTTDGRQPCLPTRAQLGSDGTVTSQSYLACDGTSCVAAAAPVITAYLQACDATVVSQVGSAGVNGTYVAFDAYWDRACLLAWDTNAQVVASGSTHMCIGDWQCPAGSLCDDAIPPIGTSPRIAVCKPGPRGTLTPAMLGR